ncbi:MAG: hypothetical protein IKK39_00625, partial [Thermoguttaceae bacterium]|nr:hypothetical protein [Thermoguttaceae bacterium]
MEARDGATLGLLRREKGKTIKFLGIFLKSPLRFWFLGVYSYLSPAMSLTTTTAGSLLSENENKNFSKKLLTKIKKAVRYVSR